MRADARFLTLIGVIMELGSGLNGKSKSRK